MRKTKRIPKAIRPEEFKDLIKVIPKKHNKHRIAFILAYGSGMRISEVLRCEKSHFRNNSIFIPESKNGVERVVPIPKGLKKSHLEHLPIGLTPRALQKCFKKYCAFAHLKPEYTFHSLRHGFATRSLERGMPINHLQLLLGHSNLSTTNEYTKANPIDALASYEEYF
jgi:integrase/recombinase XerD